MNTVNTVVVESTAEFQRMPSGIPPLPDTLPASGTRGDGSAAEDSGVYAKTLNELQRPIKNDGQELLRNRFLCRGGGLLLVGPTGIGKSSLSMQMMISWALGRGLFGVEPARPVISLLIQAENDEGDLAEAYETERHLLYVACTRARDHLLVTGVEPASEFLDDLRLMK